MFIEARYYGFFSSITGKLFEDIKIKDSTTVAGLVEELSSRFGYKFKELCFIKPLYSEKNFINICLNTQDLNSTKKFPSGIKTQLKDGDIVSFGPIGGAA